MHLILGILMMWAAWWLYRRNNRRPATPPPLPQNYLHDEKMKALEKVITEYAVKLRSVEEDRKLDRLIAEDALNREQRAKTALTAALNALKAQPEQINIVLAAVDNAGKETTNE